MTEPRPQPGAGGAGQQQQPPQVPLSNSSSGLQPYTGTTDPTEWLNRFEEIAEARGWAREHWAKVIVQWLEESALIAFRAFSVEQRGDYTRLRANLIAAFAPPPAMTMRSMDLRQGSDPVAKFAWNVLRAVRVEFPEGETYSANTQKSLILKIFLNGLKPALRFQLCANGLPATFSAALTSATPVEALMESTRSSDGVTALGAAGGVSEDGASSSRAESSGHHAPRGRGKPKGKNGPCSFCRRDNHAWNSCYALQHFLQGQDGQEWSPQSVVLRGLEQQAQHRRQYRNDVTTVSDIYRTTPGLYRDGHSNYDYN